MTRGFHGDVSALLVDPELLVLTKTYQNKSPFIELIGEVRTPNSTANDFRMIHHLAIRIMHRTRIIKYKEQR